MLNKNFFKALPLLFFVLILSGCSLAGRPDGGIYKSEDGGRTFEQKSFISEERSIANANVLAIEVDPNQDGVVYIGTEKDGILRSSDGADSWVKDVSNFTNVSDIEVVPSDSEKIYITARKGGRGKLLKTENSGEEWQEAYTEKNEGSSVNTVAVDYHNTDTIYLGNSKGGIFKSQNGGESWETLLWAKSGIRAIKLDKVNPAVVYVATLSDGALVSKDGGINFSEIKASGSVYSIISSPEKEGVVYLSDKEGLSRSENFGKDWERLNTLVKPEELASRGLAINPHNADEVFYTSGKAFYKSIDKGVTWQPVQFDISRLIQGIEISPHDPNTVYLGTGGSVSSFKLFP